MTPTRPPTTAELLNNPVVQQALEQAWIDSRADDAINRHEEGGWIYMDVVTGQVSIRRARPGQRAKIDLGQPPLLNGMIVVGTFHTHPNPTADGWFPGPSPTDQASSAHSGVPWLIRADNGNYSTGPDSRRGGLTGGQGYPP